MEKRKCLVVLSGGQDSTTCLYWAMKHFDEVHTITFDYGQRHVLEIESARKIVEEAGIPIGRQFFVKVGPILRGTSPLVNNSEEVGQYDSVEDLPRGVEPTFVPARNILFLTLAANRATCLGIKDLVTGVCEEDFGGYPDCRQIFIDAMSIALGEGIYGEPDAFLIYTPLMSLSKKATVEMARDLPGCLEALAYSHTCYNGEYPPCGKCHACHLRQKGFNAAGIEDPLLLRAQAERV